MAQIIIDTNFLITCIKQKIDFFEFAELNGFLVLVPEQVLTELAKIVSSEQKKHVKDAARMALKLIEVSPHKKVVLPKKYVDSGIIEFVKENPSIVVATLDKEIQKAVSNHKLVILEQKRLEVF